MLFTSYIFIAFLAITFVIYYLAPSCGYQKSTLIVASSVFYAFHDITLLALLAFSISINATTSFRVNYQATEYRRLYATLGVIANLVILLFFKYSPLFARSFFEFDQPIVDYLISIPLPLGISFYTFQGISLMIDVFKDPQRLESPIVAPTFREHLTRTYLYIAFFPQLIAGPIVKAQEFMPQIRTKLFSKIDWEFCFRNLVIGYFLKMVVADNLKEFTFWIEYPYFLSYKPLDLFFLLVGYSCQIFADFAGYSSIAIGLAGLFGYKLHINFNFPYAASSFKDFWKRWHISLSSFLMEYLYFPLGGSHKGRVRTYLNLFIVMALGGLWHGAAWSYLVWGFMHGIFLSTERFFFQTLRIDHGRYSSLAYSGFVFLVVTFAWLLFRLPFAHVLLYLQTMFSKTSLAFDSHLFLHILAYSSPILIYHVYGTWGKGRRSQVYWRKFEYGLFALLLFLIFFNSGTAGTFIYFQF